MERIPLNQLVEISNLQDAVDPSSISKALVIVLRHHGDVLLSTPVFQVLKQQSPHSKLHALVYEGSDDLLLDHPSIDRVHTLAKSGTLEKGEHLKAEITLYKKLKEEDYDTIIHLTEHWRGAWLSLFLRPRISVAGKYAKRNNLIWRHAFSHHYPIPTKRMRIESYLDALRRIGIQPDSKLRRPQLSVNKKELEWANNALQFQSENKPILLVHPTARWMFKTYPYPKLAEVISAVSADFNIVITSGSDRKELKYIESLILKFPEEVKNTAVNLAGKTNLQQLIAAISKADFVISVDSLAMHIANTLRKPNISIFGPSDEKVWGWEDSHLLTQDMGCRPCEEDGCGGGKISECITTIKPEIIVEALHDLHNNTDLN